MSNKLEAALGGEPASTFTDAEGEEYGAHTGQWQGAETITLSVVPVGFDEPKKITFYKADATKIIALIAEAAK